MIVVHSISSDPCLHLVRVESIKDGANHIIPQRNGLREARGKVGPRAREPAFKGGHVATLHALAPSARRKRKLQIIRAKCLVVNGRVDGFREQQRVGKQVLADPQPDAKERCGADHVVVGRDVQAVPAVHHGQQAQMRVGPTRLAGHIGEGEAVQDVVAEKELALALAKHVRARRAHTGRERLLAARQHELEELCDGLCVLCDLHARGRVEDGQAGVDVRLVGKDAQRQVRLHILDAARVARHLPWVLVVGVPCHAHAKEGGVGDGLCVGGDAVVRGGGETDGLGVEAGQHAFDADNALLARAVRDNDQRLSAGVDVGAVQGVAGDDLDVGREVRLEGGHLGRLARGLSAHNGADPRAGPVERDDGVHGGCFHRVDDVVAGA